MRVQSTAQSQRQHTNPVASHHLLRVGARGAEVRELQQKLKAAGFDPGPVDGIYGPKTRAAVVGFQRAKGLSVDGVVGQQTWGAFYGQRLAPGAGMLRGVAPTGPVAVPGHDHNHAHGVDGFDDKLGNGRRVAAYVSGRPSTITVYSVGNGEYLQADAARAFRSMVDAARRAGVNLSATSGFRTMAEQQELYRRYQNGTGNLAARPGYSNHQNGISMDIGGVNGYGTRAYSWLRANAGRYGFVNDVRGEYWHWTFRG